MSTYNSDSIQIGVNKNVFIKIINVNNNNIVFNHEVITFDSLDYKDKNKIDSLRDDDYNVVFINNIECFKYISMIYLDGLEPNKSSTIHFLHCLLCQDFGMHKIGDHISSINIKLNFAAN